MRTSVDGGNNWSTPAKIVGEDGEDGEDGQYAEYPRKNTSSQQLQQAVGQMLLLLGTTEH